MLKFILGPIIKVLTSPLELALHYIFEYYKHHGIAGLFTGVFIVVIAFAIFFALMNGKNRLLYHLRYLHVSKT